MAVIPSPLLERIRTRAEEAYPEECCGFLAGFVEGGTSTDVGAGAALNVRVLEEIPARNAAAAEDRRREFLVEPKDLLDVMKTYRDRDEDVVGFYHSHPDHAAELSPTDLRFARLWPRTVWLIVPVEEGPAEDVETAETVGSAGKERAWWLPRGAGDPRNRDAAGEMELENVQEMIIRSSGSAEERAETAGEAVVPSADRAITPREERA